MYHLDPLSLGQNTIHGPKLGAVGLGNTSRKRNKFKEQLFSSATGVTNTFMGEKTHNASKFVFKIPSLVHNKANGYVSYYNRSLITYHIAQYTSI